MLHTVTSKTKSSLILTLQRYGLLQKPQNNVVTNNVGDCFKALFAMLQIFRYLL